MCSTGTIVTDMCMCMDFLINTSCESGNILTSPITPSSGRRKFHALKTSHRFGATVKITASR